MKIISLLVILLVSSSLLRGQQTTIKIIDANTGESIPSANVCTESEDKTEKGFHITNTDGTVIFPVKTKSEVAISFIGYQTLIDIVEPGKNYTFKLKPTIEEISEVVVTGQLTPETKDKSIYNVQVINNLQIKNKSANNLGELLSNELNMSVGNSGILGTSIQMQGLTGEHIKILIDGVPVIGRQNGGIDLGQLNLQDIDHVEIVEGPMSVVYGSNALAGAINLITKKNNRTKYNLNLNTYYETVGVYNINGGFTTNIKNHHFSILGARNFFDGYSYSETDQRTFTFKPKKQLSTAFEYGYNAKKYQLLLKQDFFKEELANYGSIYHDGRITIDYKNYTFPVSTDVIYQTLRANSKADFQYKPSENTAIALMAAYSYYHKIKNSYHKNLYYLTSGLVQDSSKQDTTQNNTIVSRGSFTQQISKFDYQTGYDINMETLNGIRINGKQRIDDYALFLNLQYKPVSNISFQGGTRFIYNTKFNAPVVYSLNAKWDPIENLNIRASYGTGFRSPSLKELYLNFVDVNHDVKGNQNLEAEFSQNFNLSFDYRENSEKISNSYSLKLYHNLIENKIDFLYDSLNASKADYMNIDGLYKTIGGQFEYTFNLHPRFEFKTGIIYYGKSKIVDLNEYTFTPDYTASINYHNLRYLFRLNVFYKYNGKQSQFYAQEKNGEEIVEERFIDAYNMLDVSVNRPFFENKLTVSSGIKNLLDVKTIEAKGGGLGGAHGSSRDGSSNIAWGRTFFVKLALNINKF